MKDTNETPQSNWATWALLQAAFLPGALVKDSLAHILACRLQALVGEYPMDEAPLGKRSYVAVTNSGYWARGKTPAEAAANCIKEGCSKTAKVSLVLVLNDDTPEVNQMGTVISSSDSAQINIGIVGTVGSIINAAKK